MTIVIVERPLSRWWAFIAVGVGVTVAILVGQFTVPGTAEIAGIMIASLVLCIRAYWNFRGKRWYFPLVIVRSLFHMAAIILVISPMHPHDSKLLINLVWPEFFAFAGCVWLCERFLAKSAD